MKASSLQRADILANTLYTAAWFSYPDIRARVVRLLLDCPFSHIGLYIGDGFVVEADKDLDVVVKRPLEEFMVGVPYCKVFRHDCLGDACYHVVTFAEAQVGLPYDDWGCFFAGQILPRWLREKFQDVKAFFCSELIAAAYRQAGIDLCGEIPSATDPAEIVRSNRLVDLGYLERIVC